MSYYIKLLADKSLIYAVKYIFCLYFEWLYKYTGLLDQGYLENIKNSLCYTEQTHYYYEWWINSPCYAFYLLSVILINTDNLRSAICDFFCDAVSHDYRSPAE